MSVSKVNIAEIQKKYESGQPLTAEERQALVAQQVSDKLTAEITGETDSTTAEYKAKKAEAQTEFNTNESNVQSAFADLGKARDTQRQTSWTKYTTQKNYTDVFTQYNNLTGATGDFGTMSQSGKISATPNLSLFNFNTKVTNTKDKTQVSEYSNYLSNLSTQLSKSKETEYTQYTTAQQSLNQDNKTVSAKDSTLGTLIDKGKSLVASMKFYDGMTRS